MTQELPDNLGDLASALCRGSNLAFALRILPWEQRKNMRIFYAFCRIVDDIADSETLRIEEKQRQLALWKDAFFSSDLRALPSDLRKLIQSHGIETRLFLELIHGVESDLTIVRYETFEELKAYCWRVACTVGLVSIRIFGCDHPNANAYAEAAGMALQITNILRDVGEDLQRGRIYLPAEDLARFGVVEKCLQEKQTGPDFLRLMEFQAIRAENYFREAQSLLPTSVRRKLPASELMQKYYAKILKKMRRDNFRVLDRHYRLTLMEKLATACEVILFSPSV